MLNSIHKLHRDIAEELEWDEDVSQQHTEDEEFEDCAIADEEEMEYKNDILVSLNAVRQSLASSKRASSSFNDGDRSRSPLIKEEPEDSLSSLPKPEIAVVNENRGPRTSRVSMRQLNMLWEFLNSNQDLATAYNRSQQAKQYAKEKWSKIAVDLNLEGVHKDWRGWSKYWVDYKARIKARAAASMKPGAASVLYETDKKFLEFLKPDLTQTNIFTRKGSLPEASQPVTTTEQSRQPLSPIEDKIAHECLEPQVSPTRPQSVSPSISVPSPSRRGWDEVRSQSAARSSQHPSPIQEPIIHESLEPQVFPIRSHSPSPSITVMSTSRCRGEVMSQSAARSPQHPSPIQEPIIHESLKPQVLPMRSHSPSPSITVLSTSRRRGEVMSQSAARSLQHPSPIQEPIIHESLKPQVLPMRSHSPSPSITVPSTSRRRRRCRGEAMSHSAARQALVKAAQQQAEAAVRTSRAMELIVQHITDFKTIAERIER